MFQCQYKNYTGPFGTQVPLWIAKGADNGPFTFIHTNGEEYKAPTP